MAFHIGLPSQHPQVAHQEICNGDGGFGALHSQFQAVRSAGGNVLHLAAPLEFLDFSKRGPIETGHGAVIRRDQAGFDFLAIDFFVGRRPR